MWYNISRIIIDFKQQLDRIAYPHEDFFDKLTSEICPYAQGEIAGMIIHHERMAEIKSQINHLLAAAPQLEAIVNSTLNNLDALEPLVEGISDRPSTDDEADTNESSEGKDDYSHLPPYSKMTTPTPGQEAKPHEKRHTGDTREEHYEACPDEAKAPYSFNLVSLVRKIHNPHKQYFFTGINRRFLPLLRTPCQDSLRLYDSGIYSPYSPGEDFRVRSDMSLREIVALATIWRYMSEQAVPRYRVQSIRLAGDEYIAIGYISHRIAGFKSFAEHLSAFNKEVFQDPKLYTQHFLASVLLGDDDRHLDNGGTDHEGKICLIDPDRIITHTICKRGTLGNPGHIVNLEDPYLLVPNSDTIRYFPFTNINYLQSMPALLCDIIYKLDRLFKAGLAREMVESYAKECAFLFKHLWQAYRHPERLESSFLETLAFITMEPSIILSILKPIDLQLTERIKNKVCKHLHRRQKQLYQALSKMPEFIAWCAQPSHLERAREMIIGKCASYNSHLTKPAKKERYTMTPELQLAGLEKIFTQMQEYTATLPVSDDLEFNEWLSGSEPLLIDTCKQTYARIRTPEQKDFFKAALSDENIRFALQNRYLTCHELATQRLASFPHAVAPSEKILNHTHVHLYAVDLDYFKKYASLCQTYDTCYKHTLAEPRCKLGEYRLLGYIIELSGSDLPLSEAQEKVRKCFPSQRRPAFALYGTHPQVPALSLSHAPLHY